MKAHGNPRGGSSRQHGKYGQPVRIDPRRDVNQQLGNRRELRSARHEELRHLGNHRHYEVGADANRHHDRNHRIDERVHHRRAQVPPRLQLIRRPRHRVFEFARPLADFPKADDNLVEVTRFECERFRKRMPVQDRFAHPPPRPPRTGRERLILNRRERVHERHAAAEHRGELPKPHLDVEARHRLQPRGIPRARQTVRFAHLLDVQDEQSFRAEANHQRITRFRVPQIGSCDARRIPRSHPESHQSPSTRMISASEVAPARTFSRASVRIGRNAASVMFGS